MTRARHDISSSSNETSTRATFTSVFNRGSGSGRSGFTLVELLTVMVIIAILLSIIIGIAYYAQRAALDSKCRAQIEQIHNALNEYYAKYYCYPNSVAPDLSDLELALGEWLPASFTAYDPWSKPGVSDETYYYEYERVNLNQYKLFGVGADHQAGTADDIYTGN